MGILITVEGGEYTGKTTVVLPGLAYLIQKSGIPVLTSREPGGSPEAETLRANIFKRKKNGASVRELAELFFQARAVHLEQTVYPFLGKQKEKNAVVLLDRYTDSTRIYQGCEGGMPLEEILRLENRYIQGYLPDLTFLLTIPSDAFESYLHARKALADRHKSSEERTAWDDTDIEEQKQRQNCVLMLPDIAKRFNEQRVFYNADTSAHPHALIHHLGELVYTYLSERNDFAVFASHQDAFQAAMRSFPMSDLGKQLQHQWEKQEHLRGV